MEMEMDVALASESVLPEAVTVSSQTRVPPPVSPPVPVTVKLWVWMAARAGMEMAATEATIADLSIFI